jgi:hypothetical protein
MYAMLDRDEKTVIACFPPDILFEKIIEEADGRILIEMTIENSPAYIKGAYENGKFYPPKEMDNG